MTASALMVAGKDTTATVLGGLTYHVLQNPGAMEKLKEEIQSNL